jgi:hypothetical protein
MECKRRRQNIKSELSYSFVADPFGVFYKDHYYIYFEYLNYRNKKGEIRYNKYDKQLNLLKSGTALNRSFHLSYPYLFKEKDDLYMTPEMASCKSGKQSIFVFDKDSDIWEEKSINIPALVDPCIIKENDTYLREIVNNKTNGYLYDNPTSEQDLYKIMHDYYFNKIKDKDKIVKTARKDLEDKFSI